MPESLSRVEGFQSAVSRLSPKQISGERCERLSYKWRNEKRQCPISKGRSTCPDLFSLSILSIFVAFTTPSLSIYCSLIVSHTRLLFQCYLSTNLLTSLTHLHPFSFHPISQTFNVVLLQSLLTFQVHFYLTSLFFKLHPSKSILLSSCCLSSSVTWPSYLFFVLLIFLSGLACPYQL